MALGTVLLRPETIQRSTDDSHSLDVLSEVVRRLGQEIGGGGAGFAIIEEELAAGFTQFQSDIEPRLEASEARILALVEPVLQRVEEVFGESAGLDELEDAVQTAEDILDLLATTLESFTTPQMSALLEELFDIAETELGLTDAYFRTLFDDMFTRMVNRLQADYRAGSGDAGAYSRYALGAAIDELRTLLREQDLDIPALNKNTLLPLLVNKLGQLGADDALSDAARTTGKIRDTISPVAALQHFFPSTTFGPTTLGAAAAGAGTCWYASWLNNDLFEITRATDCAASDVLKGVDFKHVDAGVMEAIAFHSRWITSLGHAGFHAGSIEKGDYATNIFNLVFNVSEALIAGIGNEPLPRLIKWIFVPFITLMTSLEESRFNDILGLFLMGGDLLETRLYARWIWMLREGLLSTLTLANHDPAAYQTFLGSTSLTGEALERAKLLHNHNQIDGLAHLFGELGAFLGAAVVPKHDYAATADRIAGFFSIDLLLHLALLYFGGGFAGGVAGEFPDEAGVKIFARLPFEERAFGRITDAWGVLQVIVALVDRFLTYFNYLYLLNEGHTSGGTFTTHKDASGNPVTFPGYPDRSSSPYKLPWAKGNSYFCPQGNQGWFSHTPASDPNQIYAYDFALDHGDEVLAMRDGEIIRIVESVDDNDHSGSANRIEILHDAPPLAGHDFDDSGSARQTIGVYLHGQKDGIKNAFGGTTPAIGTRVHQGQPIMLANNTGNSAFNHVHVDIRPNVGSASSPTRADYTIPFVFADPGLEGDNGVARALNWYESDNERRP